jgi:hypothetical protein
MTVHSKRLGVAYGSVDGINQVGEVVARSEYLDAYALIRFVKPQQRPAGQHEGSVSRCLAWLLPGPMQNRSGG